MIPTAVAPGAGLAAALPPTDLPDPAEAKAARAIEALVAAAAPAGRVAVAFSGGVDSTLLLALAVEALGAARVVAVTARSESLPAAELEACRRLAAGLGVALVELATRELERPGYAANGPDRCYHCKAELFARIDDELREQLGVVAVAYGAVADDLGDHRPGMSAARERGVLGPLAEAGLGKAEVRALARARGLAVWDKPAAPCLASRIPYGEPVRADKLARIERAEAAVRGLGFRDLRVRHHGDGAQTIARLELPADDLARLAEPGLRALVLAAVEAAGFRWVTLDLAGLRPGGMNVGPRRLPRVEDA